MNATASAPKALLPTIPGEAFAGGFYAGRFLLAGEEHILIVAPKGEGQHKPIRWGEPGKEVAECRSVIDGYANTHQMCKAGSELAHWAVSLQIDGYSDWYIPARDELEICYRAFKPTEETNYIGRHGENNNSVPVGHPYEHKMPLQSAVAMFQDEAREAFHNGCYWSSSHRSVLLAWSQYFCGGGQHVNDKQSKGSARAVRRFKVNN